MPGQGPGLVARPAMCLAGKEQACLPTVNGGFPLVGLSAPGPLPSSGGLPWPAPWLSPAHLQKHLEEPPIPAGTGHKQWCLLPFFDPDTSIVYLWRVAHGQGLGERGGQGDPERTTAGGIRW